MSISSRKVKGAVAVIALIAMLVTGTFAWINSDQSQVNEWEETPDNPPGGTTHDDFDKPKKDVYVENWGGKDLFVRIRLDEYMEIGQGAGKKGNTDQNTGIKTPNSDNHATPVVSGTDINDVTTWTPHVPSTAVELCDKDFHNYWEWSMGGQKYYMPVSENDRKQNGFVAQDKTEYDGSEQGVKQTLNATVMTLKEWQDAGSQKGPFWVVDVDGWAYWAQALKPEEATGLLLNKVELKNKPSDAYYYAINVVVQMATKDGTETYNNFGDPANNDVNHHMSDEGKGILDQAAGGGSTTPNPPSPNPTLPVKKPADQAYEPRVPDDPTDSANNYALWVNVKPADFSMRFFQVGAIKLQDVLTGIDYSTMMVRAENSALDSYFTIGQDKKGDDAILYTYVVGQQAWEDAQADDCKVPTFMTKLILSKDGYADTTILVNLRYDGSLYL